MPRLLRTHEYRVSEPTAYFAFAIVETPTICLPVLISIHEAAEAPVGAFLPNTRTVLLALSAFTEKLIPTITVVRAEFLARSRLLRPCPLTR